MQGQAQERPEAGRLLQQPSLSCPGGGQWGSAHPQEPWLGGQRTGLVLSACQRERAHMTFQGHPGIKNKAQSLGQEGTCNGLLAVTCVTDQLSVLSRDRFLPLPRPHLQLAQSQHPSRLRGRLADCAFTC